MSGSGYRTRNPVSGAEHTGDPLSNRELADLPEGTPVVITWSGGNGPHRYVTGSDKWGKQTFIPCGTPNPRPIYPRRFFGRDSPFFVATLDPRPDLCRYCHGEAP